MPAPARGLTALLVSRDGYGRDEGGVRRGGRKPRVRIIWRVRIARPVRALSSMDRPLDSYGVDGRDGAGRRARR